MSCPEVVVQACHIWEIIITTRTDVVSFGF